MADTEPDDFCWDCGKSGGPNHEPDCPHWTEPTETARPFVADHRAIRLHEKGTQSAGQWHGQPGRPARPFTMYTSGVYEAVEAWLSTAARDEMRVFWQAVDRLVMAEIATRDKADAEEERILAEHWREFPAEIRGEA